MKKLAILGSTGSIGVNALNVIRSNPNKCEVFALTAGGNVDLLYRQIEEFKPRLVAVKDESAAEKLLELFVSSKGPEVLCGAEGCRSVASARDVDLVVSAMSGAAGLLPTLAAIEAGKNIALANKEAMVMAGKLVCQMAKAKGSRILPVDSEHSAIFQCILGHSVRDIKRIILTASGGPFLHLPEQELVKVTAAQALNHPRWHMGKKITIDSATLMNKGLEVIEARWLFDVEFDKIHIHIHPQSIVHSLVEYIDGSVIAQLGMPDMKIPIAYALFFPERLRSFEPGLDLLAAGKLEFYPPDFGKFPNLRLAYEAGKQGGTMPAVLNAANEVAVQAFIEGRIDFLSISKVVEKTLSLHSIKDDQELEVILAADNWAREISQGFVGR